MRTVLFQKTGESAQRGIRPKPLLDNPAASIRIAAENTLAGGKHAPAVRGAHSPLKLQSVPVQHDVRLIMKKSFPEGTVVTWVAMPENRRRDRMIDHGRLLAEAVSEELSLPCRPLLVRRKTHDRNQARLGREARQKNLRAAFLPAAEMDFPVLLVDDVLTTGTTARRCAEALRAGGAPSVTVLAMTRAMGGRPA